MGYGRGKFDLKMGVVLPGARTDKIANKSLS